MATTLIAWRPSALPAACSPTAPADTFPTVQVHHLGAPAALPVVRTAPAYAGVVPTAAAAGASLIKLPELLGAEMLGATKINNYIGAPAATPAMGLAATGATTSSFIAMATGDVRNQQRGAGKVKGSDARGIPPRGRRPV